MYPDQFLKPSILEPLNNWNKKSFPLPLSNTEVLYIDDFLRQFSLSLEVYKIGIISMESQIILTTEDINLA